MRAGGNRVIGDGLVLVVRDDDLRVEILLMFDDDGGFLPVVSSISRFMVTPGIMSVNFSEPAFSERMGTL